MKVLRSAEDRTGGARANCAPPSPAPRLALVYGLLLLTACEPPQESSKAPLTSIANPASVHCIERGGRLEIVDEQGGQIGFCVLPDGRRVEEWAYYREEHEADASESR
jgi:putative hemolysin